MPPFLRSLVFLLPLSTLAQTRAPKPTTGSWAPALQVHAGPNGPHQGRCKTPAYRETALRSGIVYLKMRLRIKEGDNECLYSTDGKTWQAFGSPFGTRFGFWKGTRVGLFSYNTLRDGGTAAFDWFDYDYDGPKYLDIPRPK